MAKEPKLLTISTAAKRLGISQGTLRIYAEKGIIPVIKLPSGHRRFKPEDVERLRREWGIDEPDSAKEQQWSDTGSRLRFVRDRWGLTPDALSARSGIDVGTIRQVEAGVTDLSEATARTLADALQVLVEWLLTGDSDVMVLPNHLTIEEQFKNRPPADNPHHPDTVLIVGPGPWVTDDDGEWQVDAEWKAGQEA